MKYESLTDFRKKVLAPKGIYLNLGSMKANLEAEKGYWQGYEMAWAECQDRIKELEHENHWLRQSGRFRD